MASSFPVFAFFIVSAGLMALAWFGTPKGPHQVLLRSSFLLTIVCCYLMWAITYLAQLHPLIVPIRTVGAGAEH